MEEALRFFRDYEIWIYLILALGGLFFIRRFTVAWQELRDAGFGLERENAQARLNQAASALMLLLAMAISEFVLVSFVAPSVPGAVPLLTPTLDLLATPTITLPPLQTGAPAAASTPVNLTPTPLGANGCVPGQIVIAVPADGSEISGVVEISGTVNIPNFGFYKIEMKRQEETSWLTILAGNQPKVNGILGAWNTSLLSPGNHELSLVAADNKGQTFPPCIVQVRVTNLSLTPSP
jgi:hypothetical protein